VTNTYEQRTNEMEAVLFSWAAEYEVIMRNRNNVVERIKSSAHMASNLASYSNLKKKKSLKHWWHSVWTQGRWRDT
jgi:hypothetical protein